LILIIIHYITTSVNIATLVKIIANEWLPEQIWGRKR